MKTIITSSSKKKHTTNKFHPAFLANQLLLETGFDEGVKAQIKYAYGKLTIVVGKKPKFFE